MRKLSETDPISLLFASKRKKYLSETGAPYFGAALFLYSSSYGQNWPLYRLKLELELFLYTVLFHNAIFQTDQAPSRLRQNDTAP
jgi:hypothetical protein